MSQIIEQALGGDLFLGKIRKLRPAYNRVVTMVGISMTMFQLYTALFGSYTALLQRACHLSFALLITFMLYQPTRKSQDSVPWYDWLILALTSAAYGYLCFNGQEISYHMSFVTPLTSIELLVGVVAGLLLIEATRRTVGNSLALVLVFSLAYIFFGEHLPGLMQHRGFNLTWIVDQLFYGTDGVFGIPLGVASTFIFLFILFGKLLEASKGGEFFIDIAVAGMGRFRGGPAKTAILGSALLGTISGSAVANVSTTGAFTIPLMKRTGYKPEFAGAVEAVASSGGQIMPPIMGATAFVIATYVGIPYGELAFKAIIPALLYFLCLGFQVDFRAQRNGLKGLPAEEIPKFWAVFKKGYLFIIPLAAIVIMLVLGYSPMRAGLYAIGAVILVCMPQSRTRFSLRTVLNTFDQAARGIIETSIACAAAGMVIGVISLSGLGLRFSSMIIDFAGGSLLLTLIFTMVVSLILGMGLPTVAAYIIQVALTVPALINMGVEPVAAHMFIFYFAIISAITPPVALAAFAAAGIAGSNPMRTGVIAMRLGIAAFVIPYVFVYGPALLLVGSVPKICLAVITACLGIYSMAAAAEGWLLRDCYWYERLLLVVVSLVLVVPGFVTDIIGVIGILLVFALQKFTRKEIVLGQDQPEAAV
ncbi:TRAP transporter permease [Geopsychrobacter electrodiphilus]|uniref:TRAP transporter permease n=1 Tax=Geopsychrobacter electrodiphilus TaxID=225196 RepID=UPI00036DCC29|nr:TRAP transporter permease [Geopsychrobacter electrodiphilus]